MLTKRELDRYDRQIRLLGEDCQEKLKRAKVFIAGAGGLGSPISIYLAAAGIGEINLVDKDTVALSNLNRQILHWEKDIEREKAISAREKRWSKKRNGRVRMGYGRRILCRRLRHGRGFDSVRMAPGRPQIGG